MDARQRGVAHRLAGAGDIALYGAGEAGDARPLCAPGDFGDGLEITLRGDWEARFDNVDAHRIEQMRDFEFGLEGHGRAGALLAIAQRGVEDQNTVFIGRLGGAGLYGIVHWSARV